ncbi:MAG TPA: phage major capsid protein [Pirellula sp.]|nr:phage major capsid protein [Pirellula sp.]
MNLKKLIAEKRQEISTLVSEVEAISALTEKEKRVETATEKARLEAITNKGGLLDKLGDEVAELEQRSHAMDVALARMSPRLEDHMREWGATTEGAPSGMQSHFGHTVTALSKNQKLSALVGSQRVANGVGHCIRARVCGFGPSTPEPVRNAMTSGTDSLGGILVPDRLSSDVIDLARAKSVLVDLGMTTIILDSGAPTTIARVMAAPTPEVKAELVAFTPSDFTLSSVLLNPRTCGIYIETSRELVEDAPNFVTMIEEQLAKTMAMNIDKFGLVGFGAGSFGLAGDINISETTSSGAITWAKVATAGTTVRVANHVPSGLVTYPTLQDALLNQASGDGTNSAKLWQDAPPSLKNTKITDSSNMTSTKLVIGDFSKYAIGIVPSMQIEVSATSGTMMQKHGVAIKAVVRCDFVLLDSSAFYRLTGLTV